MYTVWIRNNCFTSGPGSYAVHKFIDYISMYRYGEQVSDYGQRGREQNAREIQCYYCEVVLWKGNSSALVNGQGQCEQETNLLRILALL